MMPRITLISCAISLWLSVSLDISNAQNDILKCSIKDGQNEIHLELKKTKQLLANKHLPIWSANTRKRTHDQLGGALPNELIPHFVEDEIGDFTFYHDEDKSAAVVLLTRIGILVGTVDTRYLIVGLPLAECILGADIGQYVKHIECNSMNPEYHLKPLDLSMRRHEISELGQSEPSTFAPAYEESITNLYPEIMVFIPHDITELLKTKYQEKYLVAIVMHYIVYFNAVDMLLSKLSTDHIKIHINLAGIVIENQENAFNLFKVYQPDPQYIDVDATYHLFRDYALKNARLSLLDSFDFFFIPTSNMLFWVEENDELEGFSWTIGVFEAKRDFPTTACCSGSIAHSSRGYEYITAAHEIAHLMRVGHDPLNKGYCDCRTQCYAIMQEINQYCPECLRWSDESINDLKKYVRENRDHCYLLNRPRSLHPYGTRMRTLSPADQCRCYGYEPRTSTYGNCHPDVIPPRDCGRSLICGKHFEVRNLPMPIDGTPCGRNAVCWDRICQEVSP